MDLQKVQYISKWWKTILDFASQQQQPKKSALHGNEEKGVHIKNVVKPNGTVREITKVTETFTLIKKFMPATTCLT